MSLGATKLLDGITAKNWQNTPFASVLQNPSTKSYTYTATETLMINLAELVLTKALNDLGIKNGNAGNKEIEKTIKKKPGWALLEGGSIAPITEELIFRAVPAYLFTNSWVTGTL